MKSSPKIPNLPLFRRTSGLAEIEALFDLLAQPALLLNPQESTPLLANAKTTELTAFTRQEICERPTDRLFPDLSEGDLQGMAPDRNRELDLTVIQRNGNEVPVRATAFPLGAERERVVLILEPKAGLRQRDELRQLEQRRWGALLLLNHALEQPNLEAALTNILRAGHDLTGASHLAIYQAADEEGQLRRAASWGADDRLPDNLSINEIGHLQVPYVWESGKKAVSSLHREAVAKHLRFLASVPLDQSEPLDGLVVAADEGKGPPEEVQTLLQILAATALNAIHHEQLRAQLDAVPKQTEDGPAVDPSLMESIKDGVILVSPDLEIVHMNASAEQMLGYAASEVTGKPVENVLIGPRPITPALKSALEESDSSTLGDVQLHRRDGERLLADVRVEPVSSGRETEAIAILLFDLSKDEQIRLRAQQLEQQAVLGEMAAIFAHEVRNPINNISTGLQVMAMNLPEDDPLHEQIESLQQDCDRLEHLMRDVLTFSGPREYKMAPFDLGDLLERLLARWRPRLVHENIEYRLQKDPSTPPVLGDARALEQVFINLINNAVEAMSGKGGSLAVNVRPGETTANGTKYAEVTISDSGPGIPEEILEKIFKPFFSGKERGSGLGLAISERIVSAHKGRINLQSVPGGTVFRIKLPTSETPEEKGNPA